MQWTDPAIIDIANIGMRTLFTVLVAIVVPVYLVKYGPANFLWFSDIGLLGICAALWLEQPLLGSMMALAVLLPETLWLASFVSGAIAKHRGVTTLATYMFDTRISLFMRALSGAFHLALPPGAIWLVYRYGYDDRALIAMTLLAWLVRGRNACSIASTSVRSNDGSSSRTQSQNFHHGFAGAGGDASGAACGCFE